MPNVDILTVAFAFILGSIVGYMAGCPQPSHREIPTYTQPIDTLPPMGQR